MTVSFFPSFQLPTYHYQEPTHVEAILSGWISASNAHTVGQQHCHLYNHLTTLPWGTPYLPLLILSSCGHSKRQTLGHGASLSQFSKCLEAMFGTAAQQPSALCQLFCLRKTTLVRTPVSARTIAQERNHMTSLFQESKVCKHLQLVWPITLILQFELHVYVLVAYMQ